MHAIAKCIDVPPHDLTLMGPVKGSILLDFSLTATRKLRTSEDVNREVKKDPALRNALSKVLRRSTVEMFWPDLLREMSSLRSEVQFLRTELENRPQSALPNTASSGAKFQVRAVAIEGEVKVEHLQRMQHSRLLDEHHALTEVLEARGEEMEKLREEYTKTCIELAKLKKVYDKKQMEAKEQLVLLEEIMRENDELKRMKIGSKDVDAARIARLTKENAALQEQLKKSKGTNEATSPKHNVEAIREQQALISAQAKLLFEK
jgi:hypothetical protein